MRRWALGALVAAVAVTAGIVTSPPAIWTPAVEDVSGFKRLRIGIRMKAEGDGASATSAIIAA
jgi:hypothetical protein